MNAIKVKKNYFLTGVCNEESLAWRIMIELLTRKGDEVGWIVLSVWMSSAHPETVQYVKDMVAALQPSWRKKIRVIGLDIADEEQLGVDQFAPQREGDPNRLEQLVFEVVGEHIRFSGVLHSVARGDATVLCSPKGYMKVKWEKFMKAYKVTVFSYKMLLDALTPSFEQGMSAVALSFSSDEPNYDYGLMGDLKHALERLAKTLAVSPEIVAVNGQVNVGSGPVIATKAAKGIPGFSRLKAWFRKRSVLKDDNGAGFVRSMVTLLAGDLPGVTGETIYADNGLKHGECCRAEEEELLAA